MFEARLVQADLLKGVFEAMRDLVVDANFDCSTTGFSLQAMDSSHVALVSLLLRADGFEHYRCDRALNMGMNVNHVGKILRCAGKEDVVTISAEDSADVVRFVFEAPDEGKISDYQLRLMEIESEHLGIPDADYDATVIMPAGEFQSIIRDLANIGDTVTIYVTKEGVRFSTSGDVGVANITCRPKTDVKEDEQTVIVMKEPVGLTFALKYFSSFVKATPLSSQVTLQLSRELPIVIEYMIADMGHIRYYLAPKIDDDEMEGDE